MSAQTPQQQIAALQSQVTAKDAQIAQLQGANNNLFAQANADVILFQAIQKALKQPNDQPARLLPTWAAHVMSLLPKGTIL